MASSRQNALRKLPAVGVLLRDPEVLQAAGAVPQQILVGAVRAAVDETRQYILVAAEEPSEDSIRLEVLARIQNRLRLSVTPHYRKVINATGIVLHTALGRAVLPSKALRQIQEELSGYSLLQADIGSGERSKRDERIETLLQELTGAEAATVVNNNAAATSIVLNTVAKGREVIVSRGHLVEIGGSFRLPDVIQSAGTKLVEVGTTNKTHARDYENAITENTAAILRVHPSNYKISGFTAEVAIEELERIAHVRRLVLIDDVGAGALMDFSRFGFDKEPTLRESIAAGADLVTASADKLIGASQGGLILGKTDLIQAVRKNPMARMLRVGKLTLAVLEATLKLFLDEASALREVPTLRMLCREATDIAGQAERIASAVRQRTSAAEVAVIDGFSQMGSGSFPTQNLVTRLVAVTPVVIEPGELAARLRRGRPPVFARVHKGQVLADPRTLLDDEEEQLAAALIAALEDHHDFAPETR